MSSKAEKKRLWKEFFAFEKLKEFCRYTRIQPERKERQKVVNPCLRAFSCKVRLAVCPQELLSETDYMPYCTHAQQDCRRHQHVEDELLLKRSLHVARHFTKKRVNVEGAQL